MALGIGAVERGEERVVAVVAVHAGGVRWKGGEAGEAGEEEVEIDAAKAELDHRGENVRDGDQAIDVPTLAEGGHERAEKVARAVASTRGEE